MILKYSVGVNVPAGWRQVSIVAECEPISPQMARVLNVRSIDGEAPNTTQSRTGARRQEFNGLWWAKREIGKTKRISACSEVTE